MKRILTIFLFCILNISIRPQVSQEWAAVFNGTGNSTDNSGSMVIDHQGNIFVTGESYTSAGNNDLVIIKYNPGGDTLWVRYYNGPGNSRDVGRAITVDSMGDVYVTGESSGTTDFDMITIKYNSDGLHQWSQEYNGTADGPDGGTSIVVDDSGNTFVTGFSDGDPNSVFRQDDYVTIKYSSTGSELWAERYDGTSNANDVAWDIAIDNDGNVYVTGQSSIAGSRYDYATIKYSASGTLQWVETYDGPANYDDFAYAIAVDDSGNVFVTGSSDGSSSDNDDYATIKYNNGGTLQWLERYDGMGGSNKANAIFLKNNNDLYITGTSRNSFSPFSFDYLTIKYDASSGDTIWTARYNSDEGADDFALSIASDDSDNIYVTGYVTTKNNGYDFTTVKYNSSGMENWNISYNGTGDGNDLANTVAVDTSGNVYITGTSSGSGTANDIVTVKYIPQSTGVPHSEFELPERYTLLQNYPNPFNPATVLSFVINHSSFVTLKVYDILGNEIITLVNEEKPAGFYEVEFSGESLNLSSGIYYYKLQAGSFKEIKKMVLVK